MVIVVHRTHNLSEGRLYLRVDVDKRRDEHKTHHATRYLACRGQHEGIIHIIWDCEGAAKSWAYIVTHWTRMVVQPAQLLAYKAAVLSRTAPDLPPGVRAEIGRLFPDTAEEIGRAWVRIWWIACSICFATLWA
uniref:RxLR effector candidate protein n=1 Tax=Hyaloperonospora arabidopsidis (strain Emoy2) TaxID=559515 RepID=M4C1Z8_HYAAE